LLIIGGAADRHTTLAETRMLYEAANEPKQLWIVAGAAHVDLQQFAPAEYQRTVLAFLAQHLSSSGEPR
jgi:fermentation-respiration switch protein FrsA (DUF1100 family)